MDNSIYMRRVVNALNIITFSELGPSYRTSLEWLVRYTPHTKCITSRAICICLHYISSHRTSSLSSSLVTIWWSSSPLWTPYSSFVVSSLPNLRFAAGLSPRTLFVHVLIPHGHTSKLILISCIRREEIELTFY